MIYKYTKFFFSIAALSLLCSCQKDETTIKTPNCNSDELPLISDNETCDIEASGVICDVVEAEGINCLSADDLEWIPWLTLSEGDILTYKNNSGSTFDINITKTEHFIHHKRSYVSCKNSEEHVTFICQKDETAIVEFKSSIFQNDTTRIKLFRSIHDYTDEVLGEPLLVYTLGQPRTGSHVHNFYHYTLVGNDYSGRSRVYHEEIILDGVSYKEVYEHFIRESFNAEPHMSIYIKKTQGLFAFKKDNLIWFLED